MKHMARYSLPGAFLSETTSRELHERSVEAAVAAAPEYAYAFVLYDVEEPPDLGPDFRVTPTPKNESATHYIGGRIYNIIEIEAMGEDKRVLAANMRGNHWDEVIQCRTGNWQPFEQGDVLVDG